MKPGCRVNRFPGNSYLKMKVGPGGLAGRADGTDRLSALDGLPGGDVDGREVAVAGRVAAPVIDQDVVAVPPVPLGHDDGPARGGRDGRPGRRGDVEALVELGRPSERVRAPAEGRGDGPGDGPREHPGGSLTLDAAGDPGRAPLRLQLPLTLENQVLELCLFGRRKILDLRHLRRDAAALHGCQLH